jgi:hypothetical protein
MARPKKNNTDQTNKLTPEMQGIAERVAGQDTDWMTITEESMNDFSMMVNPMDLEPNYPEAAKLQNEKKYVFRWCERTPQRVDELTRSVNPPLRWAIVTHDSLPEMKRHIDPLLGCVSCLDQLLLFKPFAHAEIIDRAKREMAEAKAKGPEEKVQAEKVETMSGEQYKIDSRDVVQYEDTRGEDLGDLVVDQ